MNAWLRPTVAAAALALLVASGGLGAAGNSPAADAGWRAYQRGDYASALARYEDAAKNGDRLAQFNLAMMLLRGDGRSVDLDTGVFWLTKAADAGMAQAQYSLGLLYESGIGVTRSLSAATDWWKKAAEQGHTEAQVQLATQYFLGRGAPKDWKLAAKWYEAAAENGDPGAQYIIASFYEHGDGVPGSQARARLVRARRAAGRCGRRGAGEGRRAAPRRGRQRAALGGGVARMRRVPWRCGANRVVERVPARGGDSTHESPRTSHPLCDDCATTRLRPAAHRALTPAAAPGTRRSAVAALGRQTASSPTAVGKLRSVENQRAAGAGKRTRSG